MATYLKQFNNDAEYQQYIGGENAILPNVSYIIDNEGVYFKPYVPTAPKNVITYYASEKLTETTSEKTSGLHTNAFGTTMVSHEFVDGVGTITFEEDVTHISDYAFYKTSIRGIVIPDSVIYIDGEAFAYCPLTSIICRATTAPSIGAYAFKNVNTNGILYVPAGSDYSSWMKTESHYLGYYNWTVQEITD